MESDKNFNSFYSEVLSPIIEPLECYRSENSLKLKRYFFSALYCLPIIGFGFIVGNPLFVLLSMLPSIILFGISYQKYNEMNKNLRYPFKYKVLMRAIDFLFDQYEYIANQRIAKSVLVKSMLFPRYITGVRGEDFMEFKIGDVNIMFCETSVFGPRERLMFNGIFISSSFNKYFKTKTIVITKRASTFLLKIKKQLFNKMNTIELENPLFEKEFFTIADDQVEARYILTPNLMQRILDYKAKTHKKISMSFIDNRLYCAIPKFYNLFEAPFLKPIDFECIQKTLEPVILYTDLVADLNLNLKIWSKQ